MIYSSLPAGPHERRVIVPLTSPSLTVCESSRDGKKTTIDPEVACLKIPDRPKRYGRSRSLEADLFRRGQLRDQQVLVQSAFADDVYFPLDEFADKLALQKLHLTIELCQILGATAVSIDELTLSSSGRSKDLVAGGERLAVTGQLTASQDELASTAAAKTSNHEFAGSDADIGAAQDFLQRTRLDSDLHLSSLARLRAGPNEFRQQTLSFSTSSEAKRSRDLALKVGIPFTKVEAAVKTVQTEATEYKFKFVVTF